MPTCVIAQPIHPQGRELLEAAGIRVIQAPGTDAGALLRVIGSADAVLTRDGVCASLIDAAPQLCVIANHGTGTDKIDVAHARNQGIPVVFTPAANAHSVAEHALMLMLATARQAAMADAATRAGHWQFKYEQPLVSLWGKTLGVIGLGRTGQLLCEMAGSALQMRTLVWSPSLPPAQPLPPGAQRVQTLEELLREADVISLHRPLRVDTRHTLNAVSLGLVKTGAIVINTSRGGLIDEAALVAALREGRLFGAGLDVFEDEPLPAGAAVAGLPNVVLTPHVAGSTQEALAATARGCAEQIIAVLSGQRPPHLADPSVWANRRAPVSPLITKTLI